MTSFLLFPEVKPHAPFLLSRHFFLQFPHFLNNFLPVRFEYIGLYPKTEHLQDLFLKVFCFCLLENSPNPLNWPLLWSGRTAVLPLSGYCPLLIFQFSRRNGRVFLKGFFSHSPRPFPKLIEVVLKRRKLPFPKSVFLISQFSGIMQSVGFHKSQHTVLEQHIRTAQDRIQVRLRYWWQLSGRNPSQRSRKVYRQWTGRQRRRKGNRRINKQR